ncbi:hypothetical protein [Streptomyces sp. RKAG293]|uniref:hypothetical protein n=1 Tax=Streptomyces sp. RKAG293 TaxID=2893403 RepID=UPI002034287C|nr:hypothetical protein [Streptomyces sp. RKAG293]MCM2416654.1 hypothetical protein [Streptomyces sp. RKAG293]
MKMHLTRDSVAMGDDFDAPHNDTRDLPAGMRVHEAVAAVAKSGYLAHIAGGKASWILTSAGTPIAVLAQQWNEPQFLTPGDAALASLAADDGVVRWNFLYRTQENPVAVYEELRAAQTT